MAVKPSGRMVNLGLIGCGNIGRRHLEGCLLSQESFPVNIQAYDAFPCSSIFSPYFIDSIADFQEEIDICFIATPASPRLNLLRDLLSLKKVRFIVLEKVAFQSEADFLEALKLENSTGTKIYVNCPLRIQPLYQKVAELLGGARGLSFNYEYSQDFKLSSSLIHILDLFCFLQKDHDVSFDMSKAHSSAPSSKHQECLDFHGEVGISNSQGDTLTLKKGHTRFTEILNIEGSELALLAKEGPDHEDDSVPRMGYIMPSGLLAEFLWQSRLTAQCIKDILKNGICNLPTLGESASIHTPMLAAFNSFFNLPEENRCPIT